MNGAAKHFTKLARDGTEICRHQPDGSMRVMLKPQATRLFDWHKPKVTVPVRQWRPATGITRWEFARNNTPDNQRPLFEALQDEVQRHPPRVPPIGLLKEMLETRAGNPVLDNGLPGAPPTAATSELLDKYILRASTPDGQWRFSVQAVRLGEGEVADRLDVRHRDYRTIADWTLLTRLRAWCLADNRYAFIPMPGQDINEDGWEHCYENATPNNLVLIAPRYTQ